MEIGRERERERDRKMAAGRDGEREHAEMRIGGEYQGYRGRLPAAVPLFPAPDQGAGAVATF